MNNRYKTWKDKGGYFHLNENPSVTDSENGPLFTGEVAVFAKLNEFSIGKIDVDNMIISDTVYRSSHGGTHPAHVSFDDMTGFHILAALGYTDHKFPICRWDNLSHGELKEYWLHPRDIIFYGLLRNKFWGYLLSPLLLIMALVSYRKARNHTSGKCMWFARWGCLKACENLYFNFLGSLGLWLGDVSMKKEHGVRPFTDVFDIYFKNEDHPCRKEIRNWYGRI